jgi:hypothetical protein
VRCTTTVSLGAVGAKTVATGTRSEGASSAEPNEVADREAEVTEGVRGALMATRMMGITEERGKRSSATFR